MKPCNTLTGVKVERSSGVKDELVLSGNDIELVSRSAALINQVKTLPPSRSSGFADQQVGATGDLVPREPSWI